jgi:hypothetical protein
MELNVETTEVIRISGQPSVVQIAIDQKQMENVGHFNSLVAWQQVMKGVQWNEIQDCNTKSCIQQEEESLHQQIGLKI